VTYRDDSVAFTEALATTINRFKVREQELRAEHGRLPESPPPPSDLLERTSRRFLIDPLLAALGWDPGDPAKAIEEARTKGLGENWLFFDYLGLRPQDRAPVVVFEAKRYDLELPRKQYKSAPNATEMPVLIADAINALRVGDKSIPVVSEWAGYLRDMRDYIASFDDFGRVALKRAMISSGRWIIVFNQPSKTFLGPQPAEANNIHCFVDFTDMMDRRAQLFSLLARDRIVDTLPLVLSVPDALHLLMPADITAYFKGTLIATSGDAGARRVKHPHRTAYPALIVRSGTRLFGIVDFDKKTVEPDDDNKIPQFLNDIAAAQTALETSLANLMACAFVPADLTQFEGFPVPSTHSNPLRKAVAPVAGSSAERIEKQEACKAFVTHSDDPDAVNEFLVATGTSSFHKEHLQRGPDCAFHDFKSARKEQVSEKAAIDDYRVDGFTRDGQLNHCAHRNLLALRASRCRIKSTETHLCCRACIYEQECWSDPADNGRRPCP